MFTIEKVPKRKCGLEATALGILGGSSVLGVLGGFATNKDNQMYGASQSDAARTWSTNERLAAQEYNTKERLAVQEYNNPVNQMSLARAAGLNPNAFGSGVSFVGSQPQSSAPATAPMSGIGTAQVPNIPQLISSGSELVNALSKRQETQASLPLIGEQVKYYVQKTFGEQISNDLLQLEKQFKQSTLPVEIKSKFEELAKLQFEKVVAQQTGEKFKADTQLLKTQNDVENIVKNLKGEELIQAQYLTQNWYRINNAMINLQKSETTKNYAQAKDFSQSALSKELENNIKKATNARDIENALFNSTVIQSLQNDLKKEQTFQELERAVKLSSAYKNSSNKVKIDATLENIMRILGINVSASVHN